MDSPSTQRLAGIFFWRDWHPQFVVIVVTLRKNMKNMSYRIWTCVWSLFLVALPFIGTAKVHAQNLISPLQPMGWQLGTWEATFPDGKWTVSFTARLDGSMIQIEGAQSNGKKIQGMRFFDKKQKTVRTLYINNQGEYWENKGSLFSEKTVFRSERITEEGFLESHIGIDIQRDKNTYTFIQIQIDYQGRVTQLPSTEHKRISGKPSQKSSD